MLKSKAMSLNSAFVEVTTTLLWVSFLFVDASLSLPWLWLRIVTRFPSTTEAQAPLKTIVIAGASFLGLAAWREFRKWHNRRDVRFRVLLLDQKDYFEYVPGVLRLSCQPNISPTLARSLLLHDGFIQGRLISASATHVTYMESPALRKTLPFDYIILATGSSYSYPITASPTTETNLAARAAGWQRSAEQLQKASSILILGGGAVGTELAAEIIDHYAHGKSITLLEASCTLLPLFPPTTSQYAEKWLRKRGVQLVDSCAFLLVWNI